MKTLLISVLLLTLTFVIPAQTPDLDPEDESPRIFTDARVIRVKFVDGEAFVEREEEEGWEDLVENLPVFEGDVLATEEGRVELYLGRLNHLRVDRESQLEIVAAPALRKTDWTILLHGGQILVDLRELDHNSQTSVRTADCEVFFITPGVYRIDTRRGGQTRVWTLEGAAQVLGDEAKARLNDGRMLVMGDGDILEPPQSADLSDTDEFLAFHQDRSQEAPDYRTIGTAGLEETLEDYEPELNRYGRWEYSAVYGCSIWYPYALPMDWQPYVNGRWTHHPVYGYVWTSYDPCGWITHHYGRWQWNPVHGWYWLPGYQWSPAWVYWGWSSDYYCWAPLGRNNRPVIVINKRWLKDYRHRQGMPVHASSVAVVHRDRLRSHRIGDFITRRIGSDLVEDRLHFHGQPPVVRINDPLLYGRTRSGKTILIKQGSVSRTQVDPRVPVVIHSKSGDAPSMEASLRSVRRVIREKSGSGVSIDSGVSSSGSGSESRVVRRSSSSGSSKGKSSSAKSSSSKGGSSGSKTVVKKKK